jgi:hypothetical protein
MQKGEMAFLVKVRSREPVLLPNHRFQRAGTPSRSLPEAIAFYRDNVMEADINVTFISSIFSRHRLT